MKKIFWAIIFALFSMLSFAQSNQSAVDVSSLTKEQQQAVQAVANQMAEKKSDAPAILKAIQDIASGWQATIGWILIFASSVIFFMNTWPRWQA